jgi:hypothetical protein
MATKQLSDLAYLVKHGKKPRAKARVRGEFRVSIKGWPKEFSKAGFARFADNTTESQPMRVTTLPVDDGEDFDKASGSVELSGKEAGEFIRRKPGADPSEEPAAGPNRLNGQHVPAAS